MKIRIGALLLVALLLVMPSVPSHSSLQDFPESNQALSINNLASMNSLTWHDDCSNVSGWNEPIEPIPGIVSVVQPGIPLLANETGLTSDTIPGYAADDHGSIYLKCLDTPMALFGSLELSVEIEHIGAPNKTGSVCVFLLDAANESVFRVDCYDVWNESTSEVRVTFRDIDGRGEARYYRRDTAWSYITRMWYDVSSDSIRAYIVQWEPRLSSSGNFNPNRVIQYVGVAFYNTQFNSFESAIVKDILVSSERDTTIWHHDCSNTTSFTHQPSWSMNWWIEDYDVTPGDMWSSGDYLFFDIPDYSPAMRWHGPIYVHPLSTQFRILHLVNFSVHLDVDNSKQTYSGIIDVSLYDSEFIPVVSIQCTDSWNYYNRGHNSVVYWYRNLTQIRHGKSEWDPWTSFNGTIRAWYDMEMGLMGSVPGYGLATLASPEEVEVHREIAYIVISAARLTNYAWMPSLIRDIVLSPATPLSSTTPTMTSPTTTSTSTETISIDLFLTLGIAIEIVGIALIITIARLKKHGYYES